MKRLDKHSQTQRLEKQKLENLKKMKFFLELYTRKFYIFIKKKETNIQYYFLSDPSCHLLDNMSVPTDNRYPLIYVVVFL